MRWSAEYGRVILDYSGEATLKEKDEIRQMLIDFGETDKARLHFETERVFSERHRKDPTLRQRQDAARNFGEGWVGAAPRDEPEESDDLTDEERRHLVELLDGANHPLSASAAAKLARALGGKKE